MPFSTHLRAAFPTDFLAVEGVGGCVQTTVDGESPQLEPNVCHVLRCAPLIPVDVNLAKRIEVIDILTMQRELGSVLQIEEPLPPRLVALVKSLLSMSGMTDFQVRPWGIRRTSKSVHGEFDGLPSPSMGNSTDFQVRPWGIRRTRKSVNGEFDGLGSPSMGNSTD